MASKSQPNNFGNNDYHEGINAPEETTEQIVSFVDEGTTQSVDALVRPVEVERPLQDAAFRQQRTHSILDFLKRPTLLTSFMWSESDGYNVPLLTLDFPEAFIQSEMYREKLQGFVAMRGTLVCELRANPQPFQQGALRMAYVPNAQNMPNKDQAISRTLTSFVSLPGVDLRVPMQTVATLRMPFISPQLAVNLVTGEGFYGRLRIHVYSPLVGPTSPDVAVSLFVRMEDPQLEYPTGSPIADNFSTTTQKMSARLKTLPRDKIDEIAQMPVFQGVQEDEEAQVKNSGTISKLLLATSGVAGVASLFPPATAIAAPIAVGAAGLAGVTSLFGWSKPTNLGDNTMAKLKGAAHMANSNGEDASHNLGICAGNALKEVTGVLGADLDEMAFPVMQSIPGFIRNFGWSTFSSPGTLLTSFPVTPVLCAQTMTTGLPPTVMDTTMMGYIANKFSYWRGDIVFTFKVIKTNYHSGRLRFVYVPGAFDISPPNGKIDYNKCYSMVLDLRVSDTAQFTCPYVSTAPWLMVRPEDNTVGISSIGTPFSSTGMLYVEILNQLVASDVVSPEIDILTEVCADPSMRFAAPRRPLYLPTNTFPESAPEEKEMPVFQGPDSAPLIPLTRSDFMSGKRAPPIGDGSSTDPTCFVPEESTIGETILSSRHLLKRFSLIASDASNNNTGGRWAVLPYGKCDLPTEVDPFELNPFDDFSYWSFPFAFGRGSMRLKFFAQSTIYDLPGGVVEGGLETDITVRVRDDIYSLGYQQLSSLFDVGPVSKSDSIPPGFAAGSGSDNQQVSVLNVEGGAEVQIPFYNRLHNIALETEQKPTFDNVNRGNIPLPIIDVEPTLRRGPGISLSNYGTQISFYRAVGDDFSMSFLLAPPRLIRVEQLRTDTLPSKTKSATS